MPRANRYILPGQTYHVTHRCHDRAFLLRFAKHRELYRTMLRERAERFGVCVLGYEHPDRYMLSSSTFARVGYGVTSGRVLWVGLHVLHVCG